MLEIPTIGDKPAKLKRVYQRFVKKRLAKGDGILKTLQSEPAFLIETFTLLMKPARLEDLTKIMNMKNIKKSEQSSLLNKYNATVDKKDQILPHIEDKKSVRSLFKGLL